MAMTEKEFVDVRQHLERVKYELQSLRGYDAVVSQVELSLAALELAWSQEPKLVL